MIYTLTNGHLIRASSPQEFVSLYRASSFFREKDEAAFMRAVACRASVLGLKVDTSSHASFLESLKTLQFVRETYEQ